jgi:hypothetical protein
MKSMKLDVAKWSPSHHAGQAADTRAERVLA